MWTRTKEWLGTKKTMVAIEWIWLFIGTAAVFAHLVEAWASPYLPAVWMVGVLVLFLVYRLGMAAREVYWPAPERSAQEKRKARIAAKKKAYEAERRQSGDGIVSTTEWVPPHIRGRKARAPTPVDADKTAEQLEVPSASGRFDAAEMATVLAEVDEDTEPSPTEIVAVAIPYQKTSIVRVDKSELRPETDADLSIDNLVIPSFAESALTGDERKKAMDAVGEEPTNPIRIKDEPEADGAGDGDSR